MNILITGGTGFIGKYLIPSLVDAGHIITILSRRSRKSSEPQVSYRQWNGKEMPTAIGLYDVVINLAGASIAEGKWTESRKKLIIKSRVDATKACVNFINESPNPPKVFLSASAIGYYGGKNPKLLDESSPVGDDFPAIVTEKWEQEAQKANVRTALLRIGVVVGKGGGALEKMLPVYKMGMGGKMGNGKQGFPWVHVDDVVEAINFIMANEEAEGPFNLVGPETISQGTFSSALGEALSRPEFMVVPPFALKMMLGEQSMLLLGGQKASPQKLIDLGFDFKYPKALEALKSIV